MSHVPPFQTFYAVPGDMNRKQRAFYDSLVPELKAGKGPDVDGQVSYLYVYAYTLLEDAKPKRYAAAADALMDLASAYHTTESGVAEYCRHWAADCFLAMENGERYIELTEPSNPIGRWKMVATNRLNVTRHYSLAADPIDLVKLLPVRLTRTAKEQPARFRDLAREHLESAESEAGTSWLDRLDAEVFAYGDQDLTLFNASRHAHVWTERARPYQLVDKGEVLSAVNHAVRAAENQLRDELGLPRIGEGWIAETELYHAVVDALPGTDVIQHGRPPWLGRQHFDIWIPRWKIAIEHHGRQHFEPIDFFGGEEAFQAGQARDLRKVSLALEHGAHLIVSTAERSHEDVIGELMVAIEVRRRGS